MDLLQAVSAPLPFPFGDGELAETHPVKILKLKEWAPLQVWIVTNCPDPIQRASAAIAKAKQMGKPFDLDTKEDMLDHAQREALAWPPKPGSASWIAAIDGVDGGPPEFLYTVLSATTPGTTREKAKELTEKATSEQIARVFAWAMFGMRDPKKAGTAVPSNPDGSASPDLPPSATNGATSSGS